MKKHIATIIFLAFLSLCAQAQEMNTTYFLDNNVYRYHINPALAGEKGFVAVGLGNINCAVGSSNGIGTFLYKNPNDAGLVTALNSSISSEEFLAGIPDLSIVRQSMSMNVIAVGFWAGKSFHNIELNLHEDVSTAVSKGMFAFLKGDSETNTFDFSGTCLSAKCYAELAYGYSRSIGKKFAVGGRVKFLLGLENGQVSLDDASATVNGSEVSYDIDGSFRLVGNFVNVGTKVGADNSVNLIDYNNINVGFNSPTGYGGAVDLGMTYNPLKNLSLSLALLDVGGIRWNYNTVGKTSGTDSFTGVEYQLNETIDNPLESALEKLKALGEVESLAPETSFEWVGPKVNLGARYNMPFYERLSVGALYSHRFDSQNPFWSLKGGLTLTPIDWFSVAGSFGVDKYNTNFGVAASLNLANINFLAGVESYSGKVAQVTINNISLMAPLGGFDYMVRFGINITFGERHNAFSTKYKLFKRELN